jgi:hypothetical protein
VLFLKRKNKRGKLNRYINRRNPIIKIKIVNGQQMCSNGIQALQLKGRMLLFSQKSAI